MGSGVLRKTWIQRSARRCEPSLVDWSKLQEFFRSFFFVISKLKLDEKKHTEGRSTFPYIYYGQVATLEFWLDYSEINWQDTAINQYHLCKLGHWRKPLSRWNYASANNDEHNSVLPPTDISTRGRERGVKTFIRWWYKNIRQTMMTGVHDAHSSRFGHRRLSRRQANAADMEARVKIWQRISIDISCTWASKWMMRSKLMNNVPERDGSQGFRRG